MSDVELVTVMTKKIDKNRNRNMLGNAMKKLWLLKFLKNRDYAIWLLIP